MQIPVKLIGNVASPYTRKMIAYLRYKRIPYEVIWGQPEEVLKNMNIEAPKPVLLPVFLFEREGQLKAECDSTPIIREFEEKYSARSVLPNDPALNFINYVLEDFGDEWCTKYMFHYRWYFQEDADNAGTILPLGINSNLNDEELKFFKDVFAKRQIDRLWVVGSNDDTAEFIDKSYRNVLKIFENHFKLSPFLLGNTPSSCDFAIYGQFTQLVGFDPTPRRIAHEISPRTIAWVNTLDDRGGLDFQENNNRLEDISESIHELFKELSVSYVPTMIENSNAHRQGNDQWEVALKDNTWKQKTFPYQAKCLNWIREEFSLLNQGDKERVLAFLTSNNCQSLIEES
ncbi:MAG: glutathione S-transferase N-terminal domain-containing protein [Gammaproteobacteria bacterium]|jgi:glutathione S-transferase